MTGKKLGNDSRLWIKVSGTWHMISGNQNLSRSLSSASIDTTTKDDGQWSTNAPGMRGLSIASSFMPAFPDTGFDALSAAVTDLDTQSQPEVQIREGGEDGADPDDVVFHGFVNVSQANDTRNQNTANGYDFTLTPAAKPLVYAL